MEAVITHVRFESRVAFPAESPMNFLRLEMEGALLLPLVTTSAADIGQSERRTIHTPQPRANCATKLDRTACTTDDIRIETAAVFLFFARLAGQQYLAHEDSPKDGL